MLFVCLFVLVVLLDPVEGFSQGAPAMACGTLSPLHGVSAQTSEPPYTLSTVDQDGTVTVDLVAEEGASFRGFLIQARDPGTGDKIAGFAVGEDTRVQLLSCGEEDAALTSSVTHTAGNNKTAVQLTFSRTDTAAPTPIFRATVVQERAVFWEGISTATPVS